MLFFSPKTTDESIHLSSKFRISKLELSLYKVTSVLTKYLPVTNDTIRNQMKLMILISSQTKALNMRCEENVVHDFTYSESINNCLASSGGDEPLSVVVPVLDQTLNI